ncbi:zeta toxin family protein [Neisseria chenwenguii]|uniref:zeta toxin family protein n=1 Tax=Neisseria chenwenguii TaxID=1853278 RepID=UPI001E34A7FC|nr:zeta toxin family protein [Neisseria chenwenguii]
MGELTAEKLPRPSSSPKGFVLGGQPRVGKSNLVIRLRDEMKRNLLVINGDEFRRYHPDFEEIQNRHGKDAPKYTADFSATMTGMVIEKALHEGYNISVEGTFRTAETPLKTLDDIRRHGYETTVCIHPPSEVSWQSTLERYDAMLAVNEFPRHTDKAHHDLVTKTLPINADKVYLSGKADYFLVYSCEGLLFDSRIHQRYLPSETIDAELHRNTRKLAQLETDITANSHLLSGNRQ